MKHLIRRGLIDVWQLLLLLAAYLVGLMFIYAASDQMAMFLTLLASVKLPLFLGVILLGCLVRFIFSLAINYRKAEYVSRMEEGYTFDKAAEIIGRAPDAFEHYGFGQQ